EPVMEPEPPGAAAPAPAERTEQPLGVIGEARPTPERERPAPDRAARPERREGPGTAPETAGAESSRLETDAVVVTDMAAIGASPTFYEFEELEAAPAARRAQVEPKPPARSVAAPLTLPAPPAPPPPPPPPSTGGIAEPNDQPYGDVFFKSYGTNPFIDTEDDPLSTFGLDVDTGSYGVVRRYLADGHLPPPEAVRVEELVNAFDYGDRPPGRGDFALGAEGSRSPFAPPGPPGLSGKAERYHLVRFSIRAREVAAADRKSAVLTFVVDVSGSMATENRLGLVQRALGLLLAELRPDDRVGLVVYGSRGQVVLDHTSDLGAIRRAVESLRPEGSTNAEEGLALAYELAGRGFREGAINRVILCSDGVANVGATGPESILERIGAEARRGIELTTVGFGMGNYNDVLMEQLANRGDGAYAYVDTLDEARRVFVENLTGTLQTVAGDAKVQVAFDPEVVSRYRLLGYENRDVADERFRDDTVDAGEVGAGHGVTALYELKLHPAVRPRAAAATLTLRYRSAETGRVEELSRSITAGELDREWDDAPAGLRLASVVAELGEILKGSYWAKDGDLDDLFRRAQALSAERRGDLRVAELAALIGRAAALGERP
ncbi:MAG TPA: von Willebrand factor type A domain-containing protein, partial [Thermoanaerobaculia bacterium]|nr:von Willebrand factor type A domain-containing protein [Thermoanaerobaculia bacterium]